MITIKTMFDGNRVVLSKEQLRKLTPGEVLLVFGDSGQVDGQSNAWLGAQEDTLNEVWDNDEDSVYDES